MKSTIKNGTELILNLSFSLILCSISNILLWTDTKVSKHCKAFANSLFANLKFSKTQLPKIVQLRGFIFYLPDVFNLLTKGLYHKFITS